MLIIPLPAFAQELFFTVYDEPIEMEFYKNVFYEFSFDIPTNWRYSEDFQAPDGTAIQTFLYPDKYDPLFHIDTPVITVIYKNIPESDVPILNADALERYFLDDARRNIQAVKIVSSDLESKSWGWIVTSEVRYSMNRLGFGESQQYHQIDKIFVFKDREFYDVGYVAIEEGYFDKYYPVYANVIDTLVIKGVVVPEFHEIAIMVLGSGIIGIIAISKKFGILKNS